MVWGTSTIRLLYTNSYHWDCIVYDCHGCDLFGLSMKQKLFINFVIVASPSKSHDYFFGQLLGGSRK